MEAIDETGKVYGRLTVLGRSARPSPKGEAYWRCQCACGNLCDVIGRYLRRGITRSCGCLQRDIVTTQHTTHQGTHLPEYRVWLHIKSRCYNPNDPQYPRYGGRGIQVDEQWRHSFKHFLEDVGPRPDTRHVLTRIDKDGHYGPGNCCWALRPGQRD